MTKGIAEIVRDCVEALKWADRQFSALVTEDDGDGVFARGVRGELAGFGIGRDKLRAAIKGADHLEAVQTPQEESGFRIERTKDDPSLVRVINVHGSFLVKVAPDTSAPFKSGSAVQTPPTEKE
jgi:hypothetical protein